MGEGGQDFGRQSGVIGRRCALVSGKVSDVKFPSIQPLDDNESLIEATDDNDYAYLLAHKLTEGTYRLLPVNEKNLDAATQKRAYAWRRTPTPAPSRPATRSTRSRPHRSARRFLTAWWR
jgi:hypothetical protein